MSRLRPRPIGAEPIFWTYEMLRELHQMRQTRKPYLECAERLGICHTTVAKMCKRMGWDGKQNRGNVGGTRRHQLEGQGIIIEFDQVHRAQLKALRAEGLSLKACAQRIGALPYATIREARRMGLGGRYNEAERYQS